RAPSRGGPFQMLPAASGRGRSTWRGAESGSSRRLFPDESGIANWRRAVLPVPVAVQVLAVPVGDVERRIGEDGIVFFAEPDGILENIGRDQIVEQTLELRIGKLDTVKSLKLLPE